MVRRPPARRSSAHTATVVRQKTAASSVRPKQRASISTTARSTSAQLKLCWWQKIIRVIAGGLVVGVILAVAAYVGFTQMVQQALQTETQTILLVPERVDQTTADIWVVNLGQDLADSTIVTVPADLTVELPGGYGQYRLGAVYPLLELEQKNSHYRQASYSRALGVLVDQVVPLASFERKSPEMRRLILHSVWHWLWHHDTESLLVLKVWLFLKQQPQPLTVNSLEELQQQVAKFEINQQLVQTCPVGILNGSATAGAATGLSKLLEAGKLVTIRVGTFPQDVPTTQIYHDGRSDCATVVARVNGVLLQPAPITIDTTMTTQYRAAIVIVLGKDLQ